MEPKQRPDIKEVLEHRFVLDQVRAGGEEFSRRFNKARQKNSIKSPAILKILDQTGSKNASPKNSTEPNAKQAFLPVTAKASSREQSPQQGYDALAESKAFMDDSANLIDDSVGNDLSSKLSNGFVKTNQRPQHITVTKPQTDRKSLMEQEDLDGGLELIGGSKEQDLYNQLSFTLDKKPNPRDDPFKKSANFTQVSAIQESLVLNGSTKQTHPVSDSSNSRGPSPPQKPKPEQNKVMTEHKKPRHDSLQMSFAGPTPQVFKSAQQHPPVDNFENQKDQEMDLWESSILDEVNGFSMDEGFPALRKSQKPAKPQATYDFRIANGLADDKYMKEVAEAELRDRELKQTEKNVFKPQEQKAPKEAPPKVNRTFKPLEQVDTTPAHYNFAEEDTKSKVKLGPANVNKWMNSKVDLDT